MAKADLHVHSKYSDRPSEWFLQKIGAGESYTEPETIYQVAKERGMSFVTITDHNNVAGSLQLAEKYDDAFTGVEATTYFPEDNCKVHLLIFGLTGEQFEEVQRIRNDIYQLRDFLLEKRLAHSLAHATYIVNQKLTIEHLEKLVLLFDVFEAINGGRSRSNNNIWFSYLKYLNEKSFEKLQKKYPIKPQRRNSWVKGFTGGSDDHAGIYIAQTYTLAAANGVDDFLTHIRERKAFAKGRYNDYTGLVFSIYKIAHEFSKDKSHSIIKSLPLMNFSDMIFGTRKANVLDQLSVMLLKANISKSYKRPITDLIGKIRLQKVASIETNLDLLYEKIADITDEILSDLIQTAQTGLRNGDIFGILSHISSAIPAIFLTAPFFSSLKHLSNNRQLLTDIQARLPIKSSKKILWFTDTLNDMNGVSVTLKQLGWQFYAHNMDIRIVTSLYEDEITGEIPPNMLNLKAVYDFRLPYYEQYVIKVPSFLRALKEIHHIEPDEVFISTPGPVGMLGAVVARLFSIPLTGIYHTDFTLELGEIVNDEAAVELIERYTIWFYSLMDHIKVPTNAYMDILEERGLNRSKMSVFPRQIDHDIFSYKSPEQTDGLRFDLMDGFNLLYVGRVSKDKSLDFLVDVYKEVRKHKENVNLIITGEGPYLDEMKRIMNGEDRVVFTGKISHDKLPYVYSQAHALVFPSITDTYGMVVLEGQCCELPAIVSDKGGPKEIVQDGETGYALEALNLEKWTKAILDLISLKKNNPDQYEVIRKQARINAIKTTGWKAVLEKLTTEELEPPMILVDQD